MDIFCRLGGNPICNNLQISSNPQISYHQQLNCRYNNFVLNILGMIWIIPSIIIFMPNRNNPPTFQNWPYNWVNESFHRINLYHQYWIVTKCMYISLKHIKWKACIKFHYSSQTFLVENLEQPNGVLYSVDNKSTWHVILNRCD